MGAIAPSKMPKARAIKKRDGDEPVEVFKEGGKVKKFGLGGIIDPIGTYVLPKSISQSQYYDPIGNMTYKDNPYSRMQKEIIDKQNEAMLQQNNPEQYATQNRQYDPNTQTFTAKKGGKVNEAGNYTQPKSVAKKTAGYR